MNRQRIYGKKIELEIDREFLDKLNLEPGRDFKVRFLSCRQKCNANVIEIL